MNIFKWVMSLFAPKNPVEILGYYSKRALCVGINHYPLEEDALYGCDNDAESWEGLLKEKGFPEPQVLFDEFATRRNIVNILTDMCHKAKPGDHLVFTFSGHGTSLDSYSGYGFRDEAICAYDSELRDKDLCFILKKAPAGVTFTVILDSCMSGDMIRSFPVPAGFGVRYKAPSGQKTFARTMRGMSVGSRVLAPHEDIAMGQVLLAACGQTETSSDIFDDTFGGFCGAFSNEAVKVIRGNPGITYRQFSELIDQRLPTPSCEQHPQVECSEGMLDRVMFS